MSGYFMNQINHPVTFVTYRKDGLKAKQNSPLIKPGDVRFVDDKKENFDLDWYIILAFLKDANIPKRIGVTQAVKGGGGGGTLGISVGGTGFTIGGSGESTQTVYFSSGIAALTVNIGIEGWYLKEDSERGVWWFEKVPDGAAWWKYGFTHPNGKAHGW